MGVIAAFIAAASAWAFFGPPLGCDHRNPHGPPQGEWVKVPRT